MKTFRDLYIHLNGTELETFASLLEEQASPPWRRRRDKEKNLHSTSGNPICFEATEGSDIAPSLLFIFTQPSGRLWVSNIVPTVKNELNYDEYNAVLENFHQRIVVPATEGSTIGVELTGNSITIGQIAGPDVENALILFSNAANKSTGSSHPLDRKRWFEFITIAHESKKEIYPDIIIRSLSELGWSDEKAMELGIEFEFAVDLLTYVNARQ